jgi:hypothetical protein
MSAPTLTTLMNTLTSTMPPTLLRGWREISAFTRKSPAQLRRYPGWSPTCRSRDGDDTFFPTGRRSSNGWCDASSAAVSDAARCRPSSGACEPWWRQDVRSSACPGPAIRLARRCHRQVWSRLVVSP